MSSTDEQPVKSLKDVFHEFAAQGMGKKRTGNSKSKGKNKKEEVKMSQRQFTKLCKDSGLHSKGFTKNDTDIIWTKATPKGQLKGGFEECKEALGLVALQKYPRKDPKEAYGIVIGKVLKSEISTSGVTQTDSVHLHDDVSSYTGVYAQGGGTTVTEEEKAKVEGALVDRDCKVDARGVPLAKSDS